MLSTQNTDKWIRCKKYNKKKKSVKCSKINAHAVHQPEFIAELSAVFEAPLDGKKENSNSFQEKGKRKCFQTAKKKRSL